MHCTLSYAPRRGQEPVGCCQQDPPAAWGYPGRVWGSYGAFITHSTENGRIAKENTWFNQVF